MTMSDQGRAPGSQEMTRSIMKPRGSKAGGESKVFILKALGHLS